MASRLSEPARLSTRPVMRGTRAVRIASGQTVHVAVASASAAAVRALGAAANGADAAFAQADGPPPIAAGAAAGADDPGATGAVREPDAVAEEMPERVHGIARDGLIGAEGRRDG